MNFTLTEALPVLERTPAVLTTLTHGLPEGWTHHNEGGATWSVFDVVGHLLHSDQTNWLPRARHLLSADAAQPFPPFDRFAQLEASRGKTLPGLLTEFAEVRAASLTQLRALALTDADLQRPGTHPTFGTVTLAQLLATWVAHDLDHLAQVARVMAKQYAAAVGPWAAFLKVLHQ